MPELRFVADTHPELVRQVVAWLESADSERGVAEVIEASADLTKDALRIVAGAAPAPIAESEVVAKLAEMGYRATDAGRDRMLSGLDSVAAVTDGRLVRRVSEAGAKVLYEMNAGAASQLLKSIRGR